MIGCHASASHAGTCCSQQSVLSSSILTQSHVNALPGDFTRMQVGAQILLLHVSGKQLTAAPQTKTGF